METTAAAVADDKIERAEGRGAGRGGGAPSKSVVFTIEKTWTTSRKGTISTTKSGHVTTLTNFYG